MSVKSKDVLSKFMKVMPRAEPTAVQLERLAKICNLYQIPVGTVINELDSFILSNAENVDNKSFPQTVFKKFESNIHRQQKEAKQAAAVAASTPNEKTPKSSSTTPGSDSSKTSGSVHGFGLSSQTPATTTATTATNNKRSNEMSPSSSTMESIAEPRSQKSKYDERMGALSSQVSWLGGLGERGEWSRSSTEPLGIRCDINSKTTGMTNIPSRYRYMYTALEERAAALDKHLSRLEDDMCDKAAVAELQPVGIPSQDLVWVCGRILNEASEGKLNKTSVLLEGSRRGSGGRTVALDLSEAPCFALFPGQIVLAQGVNANGRRLVVKSLIEGVPRPMPRTPPRQLLEYHHSETHQNGKALSVTIAAGPFTTSDNLSFQPLEDLLIRILNTTPDVVVLMGPFVDITHPTMSDGDIEINGESYSYERLFIEKFCVDGLGSLFAEDSDSPTNFILIPSLNDAHHDRVYPQPPLGDHDQIKSSLFEEPLGNLMIPNSDSTSARHRVHLLSNPCMFSINEVMFGATSTDTLFSLSSDEISEKVPGDRLDRIAAHFLRQQSFYPMFPVPVNSSVPVDLRQAKNWTMNYTPDILLCPSRLKQMAKDVHGCMVINPGHITRGSAGGTFAEMHIHPLPRETLETAIREDMNDAAPIEHQIPTRTKVSVIKI